MGLRTFLILSFIGTFVFTLHGATISGTIKDSKTKEVLISANAIIENTQYYGTSDINGKYVIKNVPKGSYTVSVKYLGYETVKRDIFVLEETGAYTLDFELDEINKQVGEVQIVGKVNNEEDQGARFSEKNASNIINVVSAKTIERSPDINVAQVAQRVSGVTLDRSGDGQSSYAIVRGLDQRYNNTLINGIKIPSPDSKNRFVPLDIIPADLLQKLEVAKGLTPEMEGDAIGGSVNVVLKNAPDTLTFKANLALGYNQMYFNQSFITYDTKSVPYLDPNQQYAGGALYASTGKDFNYKILDVYKVKPFPNINGSIVAGNRFFKNKLGVLLSVSNQNNHNGSVSSQTIFSTTIGNEPSATDLVARRIYSNVNRLGINAIVDYHFNENHKLTLYNLYLDNQESQVRLYSDTVAYGNGRYGKGTGYVTNYTRSRLFIQDVNSTSLRGDHIINNRLDFNWTGAYATAIANLPDMAELATYHTVLSNGTYYTGGSYLGSVTHTWQKNHDNDISGYLNVRYKTQWKDFPVTFKAGGLIRYKDRANFQSVYNLKPSGANSNYTDLYHIVATPFQNTVNPAYNPASYNATEEIIAGYIQANIMIKKLEVLGGLRLEDTYQTNSNKIAVYPYTVNNVFAYDDFLPSLHLTYRLNKTQNFRLSYYKAISRPNYYEIVGYTIQGDQSNQAGNPKLQRTQAQNFDLRYEWYPRTDEYLMAGVFYKNMINPIEQALVTYSAQPTYTFQNFGTANVLGFEIAATFYLRNFGISGNYTYIYSSIAQSGKIYYPDSTHKELLTETRPLQGQSKNVVNLSLLYRDKKNGINVQLALLIQGNRISAVSPYYNQNWYQKDYVDLSFSAEKRISKHFDVFIKLNNLLNTPLLETLPSGYFIQQYNYGQNYQMGIRFKL